VKFSNACFCLFFFAQKSGFVRFPVSFLSIGNRPSLSRLSVRVRCVPYLLARKCHRCHRNDRQAHLVGNRRAFRAFLVDLNFSRFASGTQRECFRPLFIGVSHMPAHTHTLFLSLGVNCNQVVSNLSRVFLVILIEHSEEFRLIFVKESFKQIRGDLETI
jgi:hypothetical protein